MTREHEQRRGERHDIQSIPVAHAVGLVVLLAVVVFVRVVAHRSASDSDYFDNLYGFLAPVAFLVPGVVLLLRRRWHPVGWLLCLFAVGVGSSFADDWGRLRHGGPWVLWFFDLVEGSLFWLPMVAVLAVFPDGLAAQTPRQRRVGRWVLIVAVAAAVTELFVTEVTGPHGTPVPSPISVAFVPRAFVDNATIAVEFAALLVAFIGLVLRYRSSHDVARRQYRWVLSAIVFLIISLVVGIGGSVIAGRVDGPWWVPTPTAAHGAGARQLTPRPAAVLCPISGAARARTGSRWPAARTGGRTRRRRPGVRRACHVR